MARTIGKKWKNRVKELTKESFAIGSGILERTDWVIAHLPQECFDTWEMSWQEVERMVNDLIMEETK